MLYAQISRGVSKFGWLVVMGFMAYFDSFSVYIGPSFREGERKEKR